MAEPGHFWQHVVEQGYEWDELPVWDNEGYQAPATNNAYYKALVLREKQVDGSASVRSYRPLLENAGLFYKFAALSKHLGNDDALKEAILVFANKHGQLGKPITRPATEDHKWSPSITWTDEGIIGHAPSGTVLDVDPFDEWKRAINRMSKAVELFRLVDKAERGDDIESKSAIIELEELIKWVGKPGDSVQEVRCFPQRGKLGAYGSFSSVWPNQEYVFKHYPDVVFAAKCFVQKWVYQALKGHCTSLPLWDTRIYRGKKTGKRREREFIAFRNIPDGLLVAMWLQVGEVLTGLRRYKECENPRCRAFFSVGDKRRRDSKYCTNSCKNAANNARRPKTREGRTRQARGMSAQEKSLRRSEE